jgi:hypothetical protein
MYGAAIGGTYCRTDKSKEMSRHHLREDKTCLNCGALVPERYCSRCGQENTEPKEGVGHLIGHFFEDITHFDAKIFVTLKDLVRRPGFLTREYIAGKRVRYLNPIRMYVFISAIFFIAVFAGETEHKPVPDGGQHATNLFRQGFADSLRGESGEDGPADPGGVATNGGRAEGGAGGVADSVRRVVEREIAVRLDTTEATVKDPESVNLSWGSGGNVVVDLVETRYNTLRQYDSIQNRLPDSSRDKGIMRWLLRNNVRKKEAHGHRSHIRIEENFQHTIPKLMFVLLPLFALITGWFYSRKKYFYVQHAIFSLHFHSFVFLLFLVTLLLSKLITNDWVGVGVMLVAFLLVFVYLVAALRGMYRQGFWLSLGKALAIGLIYWILITAVSVLIMVTAFLRA